jgi:hypothetical protein
MVNIPEIKIEFLLPRESVPAIDLGPSRDARKDIMPPHLLRSVKIQIMLEEWPWPDEAQLPLKDIPELGKLIHTGPAKEAP